MTALSANANVDRYVEQEIRISPVKASTHIYRGAMVGLSSGYARGLTAGDKFAGIAYEEMNNTVATDGAKNVRLLTVGDFTFSLSSVAVTDVGKPVFASDDATITLQGKGNSYIGVIVGIDSANVAIVRIDPLGKRIRRVTVPLSSSASAATLNPVLCASNAICVISAYAWFETLPGGTPALNIGTDNSDPDEIVDAAAIDGFTAHTASALTIITTGNANVVAAGTRIWANVGQATSTAGTGGGLTLEYVDLN